METKEINFSVDKENKKITVEREFAAPKSKVWAAWTECDLRDQWWAPKPWKSQTKSMDFKEGGSRLYAMVGPTGEKHWSVENYKDITPGKSFTIDDAFTDENGKIDYSKPKMHWENIFTEDSDKTKVAVDITFNNQSELEEVLDMGFKEGFTMGLNNLDELLQSQN